ncbi:hypothetical protein AKJ09_04955 [Labilithrix luteola]|uniref:Uncharacterized protein n=1 Tax=Labilithrix luteola TaxID=1391654 RepID=A0A0K1PY44_9BACT|nr:hypothetical protein AKJ09_04955 [Labilithrix luteola]
MPSGTDGFRVLRRERLVELPITVYDDALVIECSGDCSSLVIARLIAPTPANAAVGSWRIGELLRTGTLEGRGRRMGWNLPNEIRVPMRA